MTKASGVAAILAASLFAIAAHAQTAIQAGEWEVTEKTTMEGVQPMAPMSRKTCLKPDEAELERLLFPAPDEMKEHGCTYKESTRRDGVLKTTLSCPQSDKMAAVTATAEVSYSATSYEGVGQIEAKDKAGTTIRGKSALSGRRVGDC